MGSESLPPPISVGILASGPHPIETLYRPALCALSDLFTIAAIHTCPSTSSTSPSLEITDILTHKDISLVLNFMPNEYHELYTIAALQAGKHVVVEAPVSLSIPSARRILDTEKDAPNGAKVFVASARRYVPCFENTFKSEVHGLGKILYARLRMITGLHVAHTATSHENTGDEQENENANILDHGRENEGREPSDKKARRKGLMEEIFGKDKQPNRERLALSRFLASLGCHDLGLMRDTLGYPDAVSKVSLNEPFYSAFFHYNRTDAGHGTHPFTLMYETGTDSVPRCDAQLAVYGQDKTVTMQYDLPSAPEQLVRIIVETTDEHGELKRTETTSTWAEAYQEELKALYAYLSHGTEPKTTARDSLQDIKLFQTMFEQYDRQCGTIRTPLG
ncbi:hypothetical protein BDV18DRAFT_144221 [Aspergillus unguis]